MLLQLKANMVGAFRFHLGLGEGCALKGHCHQPGREGTWRTHNLPNPLFSVLKIVAY
jgi:hypothetical protein